MALAVVVVYYGSAVTAVVAATAAAVVRSDVFWANIASFCLNLSGFRVPLLYTALLYIVSIYSSYSHQSITVSLHAQRYVSAGGSVSISSTLVEANRLAAIEINDQQRLTKASTTTRTVGEEGGSDAAMERVSLCSPDASFATTGAADGSCCCVSLGVGNLMVGNGLDCVMHTGAQRLHQ